MMEYVYFWLGRTLAEGIVIILTGLALALFFGFVNAPRWWKQLRCRHTGQLRETQACEAICADCHKNLGFIGTVRANREKDAK